MPRRAVKGERAATRTIAFNRMTKQMVESRSAARYDERLGRTINHTPSQTLYTLRDRTRPVTMRTGLSMNIGHRVYVCECSSTADIHAAKHPLSMRR